MNLLGPEGRVQHDRGACSNQGEDLGIFYLCFDQMDLHSSLAGILTGDSEHIRIYLNSDHVTGTEECCPNAKDPGATSKITDPFSLDISPHRCMEQEPCGERSRCPVL